MWVYTGDSLWHRLRLDRNLGFWLDYWLFLHGEDAYPIWSNRPLGLAAIAEAALAARGPHDHRLSQQLGREIEAARPLLTFLPDLPPMPSTPLNLDNSSLDKEWPDWLKARDNCRLDDLWLNWLQVTAKLISHDTFTVPVSRAIAHALVTGRYPTAAFLTRRLAAELSARELFANRLFQVAKHNVCDSGDYDDKVLNDSDLQTVLPQIMTQPVPKAYEVVITLAPVSLSRVTVIPFHKKHTKLITDSSEPSKTLRGMSTQVQAAHAEEAALLAVREATEVIETLRLKFYVRTHLIGTVAVHDLEGQPDPTQILLPQPFWAKKGNRRGVPRLPKKFVSVTGTLPLIESEAWNSAKWQLSQAFSMWSEDAHAAATHVWQGLESFQPGSGGGLRRVLGLVSRYVDRATLEMAHFLARRMRLQVQELWSVAEEAPDWYYWDPERTELTKWLGRVMDKRSTNHYRRWKSPQGPELLFHPAVGVLQIIVRKLRGKGEQWMEKRVVADLWLLYGIRNRVVHTGRRALPWQEAMHLGQLGAEVIFTMMQARVATLPAPVGHGSSSAAA